MERANKDEEMNHGNQLLPLLSGFKSERVIPFVRSRVSGGQNDVFQLWMQQALRWAMRVVLPIPERNRDVCAP